MEQRTLESVIYEREPPIARIILNKADKANTKDAQLVQEVDACLHEAGRHDQQPKNHHDRIAAEALEGLVGGQQTGENHGEHHADGYDLGWQAIPGKQHHGRRQNRKANRNFGSHAIELIQI